MNRKQQKVGELNDPANKVFPIANGLSSSKYEKICKAEEHKNLKLSKEDLMDFRVPVQVCIDYAEVLRPTKVKLRPIVLNALGVTTNHKGAKISYEQFLRINSFLDSE